MCLNNCLVLKLTFIKASYFVSVKQNKMKMYMQSIFGCNVGSYPFRCLGIPMQVRKLNNKDWKVIVERLEKKLSSWKGKMSLARVRLVLINSVVFNLSMFMMSFFEIPRGILKKTDYYRSRFSWQNDQHKKKNINLLNGLFFVSRKIKQE